MKFKNKHGLRMTLTEPKTKFGFQTIFVSLFIMILMISALSSYLSPTI